jgi:predicted RNase H-like HicB family nuclease
MHLVATYRAGSHAAAGPKRLNRSFSVTYLVAIIKYRSSFNAYSPDVPGCVAGAADLETIRDELAKALQQHLTVMMEDGEALPEARTMEITGGDLTAEEELIEVGAVEVQAELEQ